MELVVIVRVVLNQINFLEAVNNLNKMISTVLMREKCILQMEMNAGNAFHTLNLKRMDLNVQLMHVLVVKSSHGWDHVLPVKRVQHLMKIENSV